MLTTVPVIDVGPFLGGSPGATRTIARAVDDACTDIGFFTIVGHGVPEALRARMIDTTRAFFELPADEKLRVRQPRPEQSRGYIGVGGEHLAYSRGDRTTTDLKEVFAIGRVDVPDDEYHGRPEAYPSFAPNVWPERPADFRAVWTEYYRTLEQLTFALMRICAVALDLPEDHFRRYIDRHVTPIRANYYPAQPVAPTPGEIRAGAHTDYGVITVLLAESIPGLQVLDRRGAWADVAAPAGAFVCNIGDLMQRWTNDRWISTMHRVVNPPAEHAGASRVSIAFFHQANYDALIECLPTCCGPGNPARYEPVRAAQHRLRKYLAGLGSGAR